MQKFDINANFDMAENEKPAFRNWVLQNKPKVAGFANINGANYSYFVLLDDNNEIISVKFLKN